MMSRLLRIILEINQQIVSFWFSSNTTVLQIEGSLELPYDLECR